jgi:hypothetical protein
MSIHPTTTTEEIQFVCQSIKALAANHSDWGKDYQYNPMTNEFAHNMAKHSEKEMVKSWFGTK